MIPQSTVSRASASRDLRREVAAFLRVAHPNTVRQKIAIAAIDLALEHHAGITTLMKAGLYASAAAMLRPTAEASMCAWWLTYAAHPEQVALLSAEGPDTPTIDSMIGQLANCRSDLPALKALNQQRQRIEWRRFHKFTHGGMMQLERRRNGDAFSERENQLHLNLADLFMIAGLAIGTVIFPTPPLHAFIGSRVRELHLEGVRDLGVTEQPDGWAGLPPAPDLDT